jgi:hypothetical protein
MVSTAVQKISVIKGAPARPMDLTTCRERSTGITRILGDVVEITPPRPIRDAKGTLCSDQLRKIAEKHSPPQSWLEGDEEQLF